MKSSEFNNLLRIIGDYFQNEYKWKIDENGDYTYYKGKRNLKELQFMINLVFKDKVHILKEMYIKNDESSIIGGKVICKKYVDADFNGVNQGSKGATVFIEFCLFEYGYYTNISDRLETFINKE